MVGLFDDLVGRFHILFVTLGFLLALFALIWLWYEKEPCLSHKFYNLLQWTPIKLLKTFPLNPVLKIYAI